MFPRCGGRLDPDQIEVMNAGRATHDDDATRVVESILFGVTSADPSRSPPVTAVLVAVGLVASWLPARRATRIDPMNVLREA